MLLDIKGLRELSAFSLALGAIALALHGCAAPSGESEGAEPGGDTVYDRGTVGEAVANSCSTKSVRGLSRQIVDAVNYLVPGALAPVPDKPNLSKSDTTFAFLQTVARDQLTAALDAHPEMTMGVNSMLRTVAQQYLLYAWRRAGACGISLAAAPGESNHENGLAFDTNDYSAWRSALEAQDFEWLGSSDAVHFEYAGAGIKDLSGEDVLAFQKLWNLNYPSDRIEEDGAYGSQTEARLEQSPASGFEKTLQ